jgi:hypothetical protein
MANQDLVTSREYSDEEMKQPPWRTIRIENEPKLDLSKEDIDFEDTMPIYISLPRAIWKYFYAIKVANDLELSSIVSSFISTFFEKEILPKLTARKDEVDEEALAKLIEDLGSLLEETRKFNENKKKED